MAWASVPECSLSGGPIRGVGRTRYSYDHALARVSTASRAEGDARSSTASVGWGFALFGAAIAVGLLGAFVFPSRVRHVVFVGLVLAGLMMMIRALGRNTSGRDARRASGPALGASEMVAVTVVPNVVEADLVCGMLQANGVACRSRQTDYAAGSMDGMPGGPQQILVQESHLDRARDLLARAR